MTSALWLRDARKGKQIDSQKNTFCASACCRLSVLPEPPRSAARLPRSCDSPDCSPCTRPPLPSIVRRDTMENPALCSPKDALHHFSTSEQSGLSQDQVLKARQEYGPNGKRLGIEAPVSLSVQNVVLSDCSSSSSPRRPSHAAMAPSPRAVQGPAGHHPPGLRSHLLRTGSIRGRRRLDCFCGSCRGTCSVALVPLSSELSNLLCHRGRF
jgi:hypothetical protein